MNHPILFLSKRDHVALDSMVFIYVLDASNSTFHPSSRLLVDTLERRHIPSVTSVVSVIETLSSPTYLDSPERVELYSLFFQKFPLLTVCPVSWEIASVAARLRRETRSLRTPDAIQLSTALVHGVTHFVTNDDRLKSVKGLPFNILALASIR